MIQLCSSIGAHIYLLLIRVVRFCKMVMLGGGTTRGLSKEDTFLCNNSGFLSDHIQFIITTRWSFNIVYTSILVQSKFAILKLSWTFLEQRVRISNLKKHISLQLHFVCLPRNLYVFPILAFLTCISYHSFSLTLDFVLGKLDLTYDLLFR